MADYVRGPLSPAEKAQIEQLHAEGMGRNAIARELNRPWDAITRYTQSVGLSFSNYSAMEGVEARRTKMAARRAALADALLDDVERMREQMFAPHTTVQYGGKDMVRREETLSEPSPADKRALAMAASALLDRSLRLEEFDAQGGSEGAKSILGLMATELAKLATPQMPLDPDHEPEG